VINSLNPSTSVPQENLADKKTDNKANPNFESPRIPKEVKNNIPDRTKNVNKNLGDSFDLPKLSPEALNKNLQENFGKLGYEIKDN
jgi:hypothetical protein